MILTANTTEGRKTWLINSKDIENYAKEVAEESVFCVYDYNPGWVVDIVTDNLSEATLWWKKQINSARVYQGQTGVLIHSK